MSKTNEPGGKGDAPRQGQDQRKYAENYDKIFRKKEDQSPKKDDKSL